MCNKVQLLLLAEDRGSREEESMLGGSRRKEGDVEAKVGALNHV